MWRGDFTPRVQWTITASIAVLLVLGLSALHERIVRPLQTLSNVLAALREGDIILALANTEVANVKEFDAVLAKSDKSKPLNVLFRRGDWTQYVVIRAAR